MSIFSKINDAVSYVYNAVKNLVSKLFSDKVLNYVKRVVSTSVNLIEVAMPLVATLATLAPGFVPTATILRALQALGLKVEDILNETDRSKWIGMMLNLASQSLRERLKELATKSDEYLQIGEIVIKTAEDVDNIADNVLHTTVQTAYTLLKAAQYISDELKKESN